MYIYKCWQSRSTCEVLVYLIFRKPMHSTDAAFMHYRIETIWHFDNMEGE